MKFGRTYHMLIQTGNVASSGTAPAVSINYPLTLEFDITRNTFASANTGHFRIYNLGEHTRRLVFHDRYDVLNYRQVILQAGYESDRNTPLTTVFQGNILSAYSARNRENWMTDIECYDGGFGIVNGQISLSIAKPKSTNDVLSQLIGKMPNVSAGTIDVPDVQAPRGASFFGNIWDSIRRLSGNNTTYIDNEKVNVVKQGTYVVPPSGIPLITSSTGLLGTPRRLGALLEVDMIFEPTIAVNQLVELDSIETFYNGQYAVMGIKHTGTISGSVCGDAKTTLSLWSGVQALQVAA